MGFIHKDFADAASGFPDRLAVWSESGSLTYRELDEQSSAIAAWIRLRGAGPGERVGMMLPRTADAVVSIFGILKSGAVYVPLDPSWPKARIVKVLKDCGLKVLITPSEIDDFKSLVDRVIYPGTDEWRDALTLHTHRKDVENEMSEDSLAYILYTSGSTGEPKGVCMSHHAAHYFAEWARKEFKVNSDDRIAAVSPFTFDLSTFDLFSGLSGGAGVYLADEKTKMFPSQLSRFLEEHKITVLYAVPSTLGLLASRGLLKKRELSSLRTVLFAGEVFPTVQLLRLMELLPDYVGFYNLYGPMETNVCTWYHVRELPVTDAPIPIGKPLPGTEIFAVNDEGSSEEHPGAGEMCVAGPGVMSGYWENRGGHEKCWVSVPGRPDEKAFLTGDIGELRDDGNWVFGGRKDAQIKLLGYRIEPGEVESCLLAYPGIRQAGVVKAPEGALGETLVAFVVRNERKEAFDVNALRRHCEANLPKYMVPGQIQEVEDFPLTHSGKIDRRHLRDLVDFTQRR
ncbi:amino acid adenylation domain-containing protein [Verrucomicrobiota bacterium]